MTQQPQEPAEAAERATAAPVGGVRVLALVGAALALVFYLLGFVHDIGTTGLVGALVIGGGLLAGTAALPRAGRVLAPAAAVVTVGMLGLLQVVVASRGAGLLIGALVVAFLETVAVAGALLMDAGIVGSGTRRPKQADAAVDPAQYPPWSADDAWIGQQPAPPQPASIQPTSLQLAGVRGAEASDPTMTYGPQPGGAGQPQYAAPPDATALIGAPALGQSAVPAPGPGTEVVPLYGLSPTDAPASGSSQGPPVDAPVPLYGMSRPEAVNGAAVAELGQPSSAYGASADAQVPLFGLSQPAGAAGERGQSGQAHGGPGDTPRPPYGVSGAASPGDMNGRATASGPSHAAPGEGSAPQFGPYRGVGGPGTAGQRAPSGPTPVPPPPYGLSAAGAPGASNVGPAGSGPAHAAPTGSTPAAPAYGSPATTGSQASSGAHHAGPGDANVAVRGSSGAGSPRAAPSQSGAHHAPAGDLPTYGQAVANGAGGYRGGPTAAGDAAQPTHARSGSGGPGSSSGGASPSGSGSHHAPTPVSRGDAAVSPRPGSAPVGREMSAEAAIPMYGLPGSSNPGVHASGAAQPDQGRRRADTSSETTAFRAQPAGPASDTTPAFGHASFDGGDATMVAPPGWVGAANGSTQQPAAPPAPESTTRSGRHGSRRKGRHGQPDDAPDSTRAFRPER